MAISVNFAGHTLFQSGVYTKVTKKIGALSPPTTGVVALIGESSKGSPGSEDGVVKYNAADLEALINKYGDGPLVDGAKLAVNPSNDARIAQGASAILVYKTNTSVKAVYDLATSYGQLKALDAGVKGNLIKLVIEKTNMVGMAYKGTKLIYSGTLAGSFKLRVDGGLEQVFTAVAGDMADKATTTASLANAAKWGGTLPTGIDISVITEGTDDKIQFIQNSSATDHQGGFGKSFEVIEVNGGHVSDQLIVPTSEPKVKLGVSRLEDGVSEDSDNLDGDIGGDVYLEIGYKGLSCLLTIDAAKLSTTPNLAGDTLSVDLADFSTLEALAEFINAKLSYVCRVPTNVNKSLPPSVLDRVAGIGICSTKVAYPGRIKADAYSVFRFFNDNSQYVELSRTSYKGLPDALAGQFMTGGARGKSSTTDFTAGLMVLEGQEVNLIVPCVSQDASDDKVEDVKITDSGSDYDIESIIVAVKNHCKKMSSTARRKERQFYAGYRGTFKEAQAEAFSINSEFGSILFEDVLVPMGISQELKFGQPYLAACLSAGLHAGAETGQPTTAKLINASGRRHVKKQGVKPQATELFDPEVNADTAIQAGLMYLKAPSSGGIEIGIQNSTYSKDGDWVLNRPSVLGAGHFVVKTLRQQLHSTFTGEKAKTAAAGDILAFTQAIMADLLRDDIIVGDDTNDGLGYKNLVVRQDGSKFNINITITLIEGIDFILPSIALDRAQRTV